jgi:MarR family transcriptional regulator, organic hydroperoxide resistance regulator
MVNTTSEKAAERAEASGGSPSLSLDKELSFALYAASRAVINAYRTLLSDLGLTYPQYLVMLVLWERGDCLIKDLGSVLRLDYGTLSPLLKRLEAAGLIRRARRVDDERSVQVALTDKGSALREEAEAVPIFIGNAIGLDGESLTTLRVTLGRLTALVSALPPKRRSGAALGDDSRRLAPGIVVQDEAEGGPGSGGGPSAPPEPDSTAAG